jgi:hypothetical protein
MLRHGDFTSNSQLAPVVSNQGWNYATTGGSAAIFYVSQLGGTAVLRPQNVEVSNG